ncbi:threonine synthase [Corynebacterium sp. 320]|uniref:threonine synthase n=1 Tax=Corynebacterium TaxID=1716 RepID=UPI00125CCB1C|nr:MULTISPECIES: threonine synthase [Corynebacterium]KAB1502457.1 threonine synthase [Corynebacterium sp. 320]KAB1551322.1 threonine synthase [Corynebacterium sp. 321]KAB1551850.1 threonine synthase [Corynebacterium sp. 319]KAB3526064.1 threonine synthase [Corynebacterium sp. 250]KAB3538844.1 threonine synthase [Corynebacterium sp. 366]
MEYISTRNPQQTPAKFTDILLGGLAPDGGLYLPAEYPSITDDMLTRWRALLADESQGYPALVAEVLALFIDDISAEELDAIAHRAYNTPKFAHPDIVPVTHLEDNIYIGHLSEGPTAAFKDMAMQLLGELFEYELGRRGETLNILGATSGDTGSSAEYAMRGRQGIRVFMLTPAGRMTPFQQAQMFGLDDPNIFNIALDGVFDDCQDIVKAVSADAEFKATHKIGAVNSINWARLMAQIVYYISCWIRVTDSNDQQVSFSVPTGNFGDICAGHIARQMGLPIDRLIVATNENDVLDEFFRTGDYRVRSSADTYETSSPSMDISRASNFERFIFDLLGRDAERVNELFGTKVKEGGFSLTDDPAFPEAAGTYGFLSASSTHADRVSIISDAHSRLDTLIDPHTADGVKAAREVSDQVDTPIVVLETALPVKFADTIREAIGQEPEIPTRFAGIMEADRHVTDLPNDVAEVQRFIENSIAQTEEIEH